MRKVTVYLTLDQYENYMLGQEAHGSTAYDEDIGDQVLELQVPTEDIVEMKRSLRFEKGYFIVINRVDI